MVLAHVSCQDGHPIAYIFHALTPTEPHWDQIEKEMMAIVYGLGKFHQYTYGRYILVYYDHKLLESILKISVSCAQEIAAHNS